MSTTAQTTQQLQQEIQFELITANQLLQQISAELQLIKQFTSPGGEFEANIKENASLIGMLAKFQNIDLKNIPPMIRRQINLGQIENQQRNENESMMDES